MMTFTERCKVGHQVTDIVRWITQAHPLQDVEAEYLAELILETHGEGGVQTAPADAVRTYRAILSWLESTSRISPREHQELKDLLQRPLPAPEEMPE